MSMYNTAMVVDDSALERFLAETIMKGARFAEKVISFNNGPDALAHLQKTEQLPDVILLDIQMPLMTGFEFLEEYMQLPENIQQHCKVVMFSSTLADEDMTRIKQYPFVKKYFSKPLAEDMFRGLEL